MIFSITYNKKKLLKINIKNSSDINHLKQLLYSPLNADERVSKSAKKKREQKAQ